MWVVKPEAFDFGAEASFVVGTLSVSFDVLSFDQYLEQWEI